MAQKYNGEVAKVANIENLIHTVLGVEASHVPNFDRLSIRTDDRVQSRIDKNNAPKEMVERYVNQMSEFTFPPPILTADNLVVDGNTRVKAHAQRNDRYIEVLVVPISYDDADANTRGKLLYLSELINNMNGLALSYEERRKMVATMIEQNAADEDIMGKVGMCIKDIRELRDEHAAARRLAQLGINPNELDLSDRTLRAFGKAKVMKLDDNSYRNVAQLTNEAGLKANEVKALATSLGEAGSEEMRRERLARERQAREPQITARKQGQTSANLSNKLRHRLGFLLEHPLTAFVERNPERIDDHLELLDKAQDALRDIRALHAGTQPDLQPAPPVRLQ
jgi:hypothetical protein